MKEEDNKSAQFSQENRTPAELRAAVRVLSYYSLEALINKLPTAIPAAAEEVIRKRMKEFGKDPRSLIVLIRSAENHPHLKFIILKTNLIEVTKLNIPEALKELSSEVPECLRELKNVVIHRHRLTLKKPWNVPADDPVAIIAEINPDRHEKDSIEDLTKYLISNPESGFHFLRQKNRQKELAEKPVLLAKMIVGDSNLRKTILSEETLHRAGIPGSVKQALSVFLETVTVLSTPQMKSDEKKSTVLMQEAKALSELTELTVLPESAIYDLSHRTRQTIIDTIKSLLAELPNNKAKETLEGRLNILPTSDPYGLKLLEDTSEEVKKIVALRKIRGLLQDPFLQTSGEFNKLRGELKKLDENNSLSEITLHNTQLDEIQAKNQRLRNIYSLILEIESKSPEAAQDFRNRVADFNENSEKIRMDEFISELKTTRTKLNLLNSMREALKDPVLKDSPDLTFLMKKFSELNVDSKMFEFDNFKKELVQARKLAIQTLSVQEKGREAHATTHSSPFFPKKLRSSLGNTPDTTANKADSPTSSSPSQSESSIEVYKEKPRKYRSLSTPPPSRFNK